MSEDKGERPETSAADDGQRRPASAPRMNLRRALILLVVLAVGAAGGWWINGRVVARASSPSAAEAREAASADSTDASTAGRRRPDEIRRDEAIAALLNARSWGRPDCLKAAEPCKLLHARMADRWVKRQGKPINVLVYGSSFDGNFEREKQVPISVVEVDMMGRIAGTALAFTQAGMYGMPNAGGERYTIIPLNDHEYAVAIEETTFPPGPLTEKLDWLVVHMFRDGKPRGVFRIAMGGKNNSEARRARSKWNAGWVLIQVPDGLPELLITKRGVKDGELLDEAERYRWNGGEFTPVWFPAAFIPAPESRASEAPAPASASVSASASVP